MKTLPVATFRKVEKTRVDFLISPKFYNSNQNFRTPIYNLSSGGRFFGQPKQLPRSGGRR